MKRYTLYFILCLLGYSLQAQERIHLNETDNTSRIASYLNTAGNHAIIYTGREEVKYPTYILNHPYLDTNEFRNGTLSFDGIIYPDVKMRLNLHTDELTVFSYSNLFSVVLPSERVDFATIDSLYIYYANPPKEKLPFPKGYHVRIFKGKYEVWKRETMFMESKIKDMAVEFSFIKKRKFYIYKDGIYHTVSSKNSVLKLFDPAKKKELKKYIKQHKLNFKKSPDEAIVSVVKYYEHLSL